MWVKEYALKDFPKIDYLFESSGKCDFNLEDERKIVFNFLSPSGSKFLINYDKSCILYDFIEHLNRIFNINNDFNIITGNNVYISDEKGLLFNEIIIFNKIILIPKSKC